jgi:hypothetical protein
LEIAAAWEKRAAEAERKEQGGKTDSVV